MNIARIMHIRVGRSKIPKPLRYGLALIRFGDILKQPRVGTEGLEVLEV